MSESPNDGQESRKDHHDAWLAVQGKLLLAVDAGGTKTLAAVGKLSHNDRAAHIEWLGRGSAGSGNPLATSFAEAASCWQQAIKAAVADSGARPEQVAAAVMGVAGSARQPLQGQVETWARNALPHSLVRVCHDGQLLLACAAIEHTEHTEYTEYTEYTEHTDKLRLRLSATPTDVIPAIAITAGTGALVISRNQRGELQRSGGWGYLLGDEGSGFYLGQQAVKAWLQLHEQGESSPLAEKLQHHFGSVDACISQVYNHPQPRRLLADLAPLVFAASSQDREAARIVAAGAESLADNVNRLLKFHVTDHPPVLIGGGSLITSQPDYWRQIQAGIRWGTERSAGESLLAQCGEPIAGAMALAAELALRQ